MSIKRTGNIKEILRNYNMLSYQGMPYDKTVSYYKFSIKGWKLCIKNRKKAGSSIWIS